MQAILAAAILATAAPAVAQGPELQPALAGLGFLVGTWTTPQRGTVEDANGSAAGSSRITVEANGAALLRRDHTDLFDSAGARKGGFDSIMLVYSEGAGLKANYDDGSHVIHYASAEVTPGHAVVFSSAATPGAPTFRLSYTLTGGGSVAVAFGMSPSGGPFRLIASGVLSRAPDRP